MSAISRYRASGCEPTRSRECAVSLVRATRCIAPHAIHGRGTFEMPAGKASDHPAPVSLRSVAPHCKRRQRPSRSPKYREASGAERSMATALHARLSKWFSVKYLNLRPRLRRPRQVPPPPESRDEQPHENNKSQERYSLAVLMHSAADKMSYAARRTRKTFGNCAKILRLAQISAPGTNRIHAIDTHFACRSLQGASSQVAPCR